MKKFLIKVFVFVFLIACLIIPVNYLVDPYNVFHADKIRDNGIEPNKNYIKTKYIIENGEKYDSYLFGSSRVGFIDVDAISKITGERFYNMMYSEGLPAENLNTLKAMIKRGEIPKTVMLGVDDISYLVDPMLHEKQLFRMAFPYDGNLSNKVSFYLKYMDTYTTMQSIRTTNAYKNDEKQEKMSDLSQLYTNGCENLNLELTFDENANIPYWADYYKERIPECIKEIGQIKELCDEYQIRLIVFTNPIHYTTYSKDVRHEYLLFLEELAKVVPYYNFSGYNGVTLNNANYFETSHYKPIVGEKITSAIFEEKIDDALKSQGFGYYVTPDSFSELLKILENQRDSIAQ